MKTRSQLAVLTLFCAFALVARSQELPLKGSEYCAQKKQKSVNQLQNLELSPNTPRHSYDVLDYKLNLDIYNCFLSPYPYSYSASCLITFRIDTTLLEIKLNAVNTSLTIDSVALDARTFTHASNILTVALYRPFHPDEIAQVKIYYRHNNVNDGAFYVSNGMVFTDCEPEGARKWFPCWDKPSDKATLDLTAKVPATVKLGSNGRLADSTRIADTIWYNWRSREPISTYLVVMSAKVNYNLDIVHWRNPSAPNDSTPIRFYWNAGENQTNLNNIKTKIIPMTTEFSRLFGVHAFEKNGFATLNNQFTWGGMENQTLTSLCPNCWSENLVSHEFAHQWLGDMITCGTWADIWLNEGFATYCEALWYEYTGGYTSYKNDINGDASGYLSGNPGWPIYNPDWAINTPNVNTLFNTAITYNKGACVLHMLRYTLGDMLFFRALKEYATDTTNFRLKNAVTADFVTKMNQAAGQDLNWFFNQWIYSPNHPTYANTYNIKSLGGGNWMVGFRARQTQTNTVFFKMPIQIRITFATGDTTIRVMNDVNNQTFEFRFNRQPTAVAFDPNNNIVLKQGSTGVGPTLNQTPLAQPVNGATNQPRTLTLRWNVTPSAATYRLQVATDSLFTAIAADDSTLTDTLRQVGPLQTSTQYFWRVNAKNAGGTSSWSTIWNFTTTSSTEVSEVGEIPREFGLGQNYPNPFNPTTIIRYDIPTQSHVRLMVFDILGNEVAQLVNEYALAGSYAVQFDASHLSSGVYFYRLQAGAFVETRSLVVLK